MAAEPQKIVRKGIVNDGTSASTPPIYGLHHFAYRCRDAEETRHFYEDILGMPLVFTVYHDRVPSTGEYHPYVHIFFEMADGSCLAFFDLMDGTGATPDPNTPVWVNHLAVQVDSTAALETMKRRLEDNGIEVLGPIDHKIFDSIYFFDPNGIRLELVHHTASRKTMKEKAAIARSTLDKMIAESRAAV